MRRQHTARLMLLGLFLLMGCATAPYGKARTALVQGRYEEAVTGFEEVLARRPDRLDALVGLGKAKYKLGAFDEAIAALTRAVAQAPKSGAAQLYLGLSYLQKGEDGPAEEHLQAFLDLKPHARVAAQVGHALKLMRSEHLSSDMRAFIAASLEDEAEWAREVRLAQYGYPQRPFYWYGDPFWYGYPFGPCFVARFGRVVCY